MKAMQKFYVIWIGQLISLLGSQLTVFGISVWIFQKTGDAVPFAVAAVIYQLVGVVFAPIAGSIVDRFPRKPLVILSDSIAAIFTFALFLLLRTGSLQLWQIYGVIFGLALADTFQRPAKTALVALLLPKEDYTRAAGLNQASEGLGPLLTPAMAGVLSVTIGLGGIVMIDILTFGVAILCIFLVSVPELTQAERHNNRQQDWRQDLTIGFQFLWQEKGLFILLCYFSFVNFLLTGTSNLLGPFFLSQGGADRLGLMQTIAGLGILAGSLAMAVIGKTRKRILTIVLVLQMMAIGMALTGYLTNLWLLGLTLFLTFACPAIASANSAAIFLAKTPQTMQGRVASARSMLATALTPIGTYWAAWSADNFFTPMLMPDGKLASTVLGHLFGVGAGRGIGLMFAIAGALLFVAGLVAYSQPALRGLEAFAAEAEPTS
ncbi:MAG TPA: MFS transporter [Anaerolineales bacterium]|nr:MFS transporter [Anaerolineales bacterium]